MELTSNVRIYYETRNAARETERSLAPLAGVFSEEIELVTGMRPKVVVLSAKQLPRRGDILLRFSELQGNFAATEPEENHAYILDVSRKGVIIESQYYKGVAMGTATFIQLLKEQGGRFFVRSVRVKDKPDAPYRSVMIDVARNPHSLGVLKDVIRLARLYRLRYVHLHLTDNQSFTFPFDPVISRLDKKNFHYSREELEELVAYADTRGITLIPELDLPGHSTKLRASGYLNPGKSDADVADPANAEKINALIDDMLRVFKSSPYFHIGGDESGAGARLVPFLESVNRHLRGNPPGGKRRLIVWEGFHGAPTDALPAQGDDRIIVMAWESSYNPPWNLLSNGYEVINSSWKPLYLAGGGGFVHAGNTGGRKFRLEDLHRWNKNIFMHWEPGRPIYEDKGPNDPNRDDGKWDARWIGKESQILGAQLQFWEQRERAVMMRLPQRLATVAERLWNGEGTDCNADFQARAARAAERVMTIVQPVEIVQGTLSEEHPITDFYQPYEGESLQVELRNRSGIPGTIRYEIGRFSGNRSYFGFQEAEPPKRSSKAYRHAIEEEGGFSIRARLFRNDGTPVDGTTWKFFNNWPERVRVTDYDVGRKKRTDVVDLASLPESHVKRSFTMPFIRGPVQHIELKGQLLTTLLTPPSSGEWELAMKTQHGRANLYLDLNRNGKWDDGECIIQNTQPTEQPKTVKVKLKKGQPYLMRVDHMTGMPRPVLSVYFLLPGDKTKHDLTDFLSLPNE